jgi:hypothetical protein
MQAKRSMLSSMPAYSGIDQMLPRLLNPYVDIA